MKKRTAILCVTAAAAAAVLLWALTGKPGGEAAAGLSEKEPVLSAAPEKTPEPEGKPDPAEKTEPTETPEPSLAERLEDLPAGTIVTEEEVDFTELGQYFQDYEISDGLFARIYGDDRSYKTYCTVPREDLRYIKLLHRGYQGEIRVGELMVNALLAEEIKEIFRILFENGYQIEKMHLVDDYEADDDRSVNDNNTSCFNFRLTTSGNGLSNHAAGCAIDINPRQNPYFEVQADGSLRGENEDAELYQDRDVPDAAEKHMIDHEDLCCRLFLQRGYVWGGDWENPVDYQHFEKIVYTAEMP